MATTKIASGVGFRHIQVFALDANSLPLVSASGATGEGGIQASGAKALTITVPDPQILHSTGDDRVFNIDMLPPTEGATGELRTGKTNLELDALLSGVEVVALGDMSVMVRMTDKQGCEQQVCCLAYRAAQDADPASTTKGARRWIWCLFPVTLVFPRMGPVEEGGQDENTYSFVPSVVAQYPWGIKFTEVTEGCIEGQMIQGISVGKPVLWGWLGDGVVVAFNFPTAMPPMPDDGGFKVKVYHWVAATKTTTDVTATVTITATEITFAVAPADGDLVYAFYELAGC